MPMQIRKGKKKDIEGIVQLLKESLGEEFIKKTNQVWNYKHYENPFGHSHIWLIDNDNKVPVAVRAFMKWHWQLGSAICAAYRAVDTATHPKYQKKGLFSKLTLNGLEELEKEKNAFVFNTPNTISLPKYLKLGWQQLGKIQVAIVPVFWYGWSQLFSRIQAQEGFGNLDALQSLCQTHNEKLENENKFFTPKSVEYLQWRYQNNPIQPYRVFSGKGWCLVIYVKKRRFFSEARVVELIHDGQPNSRSDMRKTILTFAVTTKCTFITLADKDFFKCRLYGTYGPILTFRPVNVSKKIKDTASRISNWTYSLGDLELF